MERASQEKSENIRDEGDAQDKNYWQEKHSLCTERAITTFKTEASIPSQHVVCLSGQIKSLPGDGPASGRRFALPYGLSSSFQINGGQVLHRLHPDGSRISPSQQRHP